MARTPPRPVMDEQGRMAVRQAVAYVLWPEQGKRLSGLMLSAYYRAFQRVHSDDNTVWCIGARMIVPRRTSEADQLQYLRVMTDGMAIRMERDYVISAPPNPKTPVEVSNGIQRLITVR